MSHTRRYATKPDRPTTIQPIEAPAGRHISARAAGATEEHRTCLTTGGKTVPTRVAKPIPVDTRPL